jgi:hypothetical protein
MNRKTTRMKLKGVTLTLALALMAPAAAHGTPNGDLGLSRGAQSPASPGGTTLVVRRSSSAVHLYQDGADRRAAEHLTVAATRKAGLGWRDMAIFGAILLGILLLDIWGDVAIGAVILGTAALLGAGTALVTRRLRVDRPWSSAGRRSTRSEGQSIALWPASGQERQ